MKQCHIQGSAKQDYLLKDFYINSKDALLGYQNLVESSTALLCIT